MERLQVLMQFRIFCFASDGYMYITQNASSNEGYNKTAVAGDVILSRCELKRRKYKCN